MLNINEIAQNFNSDYEKYWNENNFKKLSTLYCEKSILVGRDIVQNRSNILSSLRQIYNLGWNKIKIESILVSQVNSSIIIVINKYEAFGSIKGEEKHIQTKSSHVVQKFGSKWVSIMHSAF